MTYSLAMAASHVHHRRCAGGGRNSVTPLLLSLMLTLLATVTPRAAASQTSTQQLPVCDTALMGPAHTHTLDQGYANATLIDVVVRDAMTQDCRVDIPVALLGAGVCSGVTADVQLQFVPFNVYYNEGRPADLRQVDGLPARAMIVVETNVPVNVSMGGNALDALQITSSDLDTNTYPDAALAMSNPDDGGAIQLQRLNRSAARSPTTQFAGDPVPRGIVGRSALLDTASLNSGESSAVVHVALMVSQRATESVGKPIALRFVAQCVAVLPCNETHTVEVRPSPTDGDASGSKRYATVPLALVSDSDGAGTAPVQPTERCELRLYEGPHRSAWDAEQVGDLPLYAYTEVVHGDGGSTRNERRYRPSIVRYKVTGPGTATFPLRGPTEEYPSRSVAWRPFRLFPQRPRDFRMEYHHTVRQRYGRGFDEFLATRVDANAVSIAFYGNSARGRGGVTVLLSCPQVSPPASSTVTVAPADGEVLAALSSSSTSAMLVADDAAITGGSIIGGASFAAPNRSVRITARCSMESYGRDDGSGRIHGRPAAPMGLAITVTSLNASSPMAMMSPANLSRRTVSVRTPPIHNAHDAAWSLAADEQAWTQHPVFEDAPRTQRFVNPSAFADPWLYDDGRQPYDVHVAVLGEPGDGVGDVTVTAECRALANSCPIGYQSRVHGPEFTQRFVEDRSSGSSTPRNPRLTLYSDLDGSDQTEYATSQSAQNRSCEWRVDCASGFVHVERAAYNLSMHAPIPRYLGTGTGAKVWPFVYYFDQVRALFPRSYNTGQTRLPAVSYSQTSHQQSGPTPIAALMYPWKAAVFEASPSNLAFGLPAEKEGNTSADVPLEGVYETPLEFTWLRFRTFAGGFDVTARCLPAVCQLRTCSPAIATGTRNWTTGDVDYIARSDAVENCTTIVEMADACLPGERVEVTVIIDSDDMTPNSLWVGPVAFPNASSPTTFALPADEPVVVSARGPPGSRLRYRVDLQCSGVPSEACDSSPAVVIAPESGVGRIATGGAELSSGATAKPRRTCSFEFHCPPLSGALIPRDTMQHVNITVAGNVSMEVRAVYQGNNPQGQPVYRNRNFYDYLRVSMLDSLTGAERSGRSWEVNVNVPTSINYQSDTFERLEFTESVEGVSPFGMVAVSSTDYLGSIVADVRCETADYPASRDVAAWAGSSAAVTEAVAAATEGSSAAMTVSPHGESIRVRLSPSSSTDVNGRRERAHFTLRLGTEAVIGREPAHQTSTTTAPIMTGLLMMAFVNKTSRGRGQLTLGAMMPDEPSLGSLRLVGVRELWKPAAAGSATVALTRIPPPAHTATGSTPGSVLEGPSLSDFSYTAVAALLRVPRTTNTMDSVTTDDGNPVVEIGVDVVPGATLEASVWLIPSAMYNVSINSDDLGSGGAFCHGTSANASQNPLPFHRGSPEDSSAPPSLHLFTDADGPGYEAAIPDRPYSAAKYRSSQLNPSGSSCVYAMACPDPGNQDAHLVIVPGFDIFTPAFKLTITSSADTNPNGFIGRGPRFLRYSAAANQTIHVQALSPHGGNQGFQVSIRCCDTQRFDQQCSACRDGYENFPQCRRVGAQQEELCTVDGHCGGATRASAASGTAPTCSCTCNAGFEGSRCERCANARHDTLSNCTRCAAGRRADPAGYPDNCVNIVEYQALAAQRRLSQLNDEAANGTGICFDVGGWVAPLTTAAPPTTTTTTTTPAPETTAVNTTTLAPTTTTDPPNTTIEAPVVSSDAPQQPPERTSTTTAAVQQATATRTHELPVGESNVTPTVSATLMPLPLIDAGPRGSSALEREIGEAPATAVVEIGAGGVVVGALVSPTMALQGNRHAHIAQVALCAYAPLDDADEGDESFIVFPLQVALPMVAPSSAGNGVAVLYGVMVLHSALIALSGGVLLLLLRQPRMTSGGVASALWISLTLYFAPNVVRVAVTLAVVKPGGAPTGLGWCAIAVFGMAVPVVSGVVWPLYVLTGPRFRVQLVWVLRHGASPMTVGGSSEDRRERVVDPPDVTHRPPLDSYKPSYENPDGEDDDQQQKDATGGGNAERPRTTTTISSVAAYGGLFDGFTDAVRILPRRLAHVTDVGLTMIVGALAGLRPTTTSSCRAVAASLALTALVQVAYVLVYRPFISQLEGRLAYVGSSLLLLEAGLVVAIAFLFTPTSTSVDGLLSGLGWLNFASTVFFVGAVLAVAVHRLMLYLRRRETSSAGVGGNSTAGGGRGGTGGMADAQTALLGAPLLQAPERQQQDGGDAARHHHHAVAVSPGGGRQRKATSSSSNHHDNAVHDAPHATTTNPLRDRRR